MGLFPNINFLSSQYNWKLCDNTLNNNIVLLYTVLDTHSNGLFIFHVIEIIFYIRK